MLHSSTNSLFSYFPGNLNANNFTLSPGINPNQTIVVSGKGNVEYGNGEYDSLDLSAFSFDQVFQFSFAAFDEGGEIFDVGEGDRVFDYLILDNGTKILFEGLDQLVFSDRKIDLTVTPNDPLYEQQWNLHAMGVQNAWYFSTGSEDILLGVQDSGLGVRNNSIHEDLRIDNYDLDNIYDEFFRNVEGDSFGTKSKSHGTSVQGIIAAISNNSTGIAGINWNSEVYHIDVLDNNSGDLGYIPSTQIMIDLADSQDQNLIINMSFSSENTFVNADFEELVAANQDDVLFVISTGNDSDSKINNPAILAQNYDNVIAVGAVLNNGNRANYSNYGYGITLTAPTEVLTTKTTRNLEFDYNESFNGTSAAAPNVAGVASLVWSANSDLTATEIKDILSETSYDLGAEGYDLEYGHGLVDADAAVRRAIALGREDNNVSDVRDRIEDLLEGIRLRFSELDLDDIFSIFDLESSLFAENSYSNQDIDSFTGSGVLSSATLDRDNLLPEDKDVLATYSDTLSLFAEAEVNNLGHSDTDIFYGSSLDTIASIDSDFAGNVQDHLLDY